MQTGALNGTYGIMYDIEMLFNVTATDFKNSFELAKKSNFKVMVTTSATGPYDPHGAACKSVPVDPKYPDCKFPVTWPSQAKDIWMEILEDKNIDIHSPQFYGDGGADAQIIETNGLGVSLEHYASTIPATNTNGEPIVIRPMFKAFSDPFFAKQRATLQGMCADNELPVRFCTEDKYYIWSSN